MIDRDGRRMHAMATAKLALVGDRSPSVRAHGRIPLLIDALRRRDGLVLDPYWIPSTEADDLQASTASGSSRAARTATRTRSSPPSRTAREHEIPFLGTCGGFQHAILRARARLAGRASRRPPRRVRHHRSRVIVELECSLVGHEGPITYTPDTLIQRIAGVERSLERYHCSYGIAPGYVDDARSRRA